MSSTTLWQGWVGGSENGDIAGLDLFLALAAQPENGGLFAYADRVDALFSQRDLDHGLVGAIGLALDTCAASIGADPEESLVFAHRACHVAPYR